MPACPASTDKQKSLSLHRSTTAELLVWIGSGYGRQATPAMSGQRVASRDPFLSGMAASQTSPDQRERPKEPRHDYLRAAIIVFAAAAAISVLAAIAVQEYGLSIKSERDLKTAAPAPAAVLPGGSDARSPDLPAARLETLPETAAPSDSQTAPAVIDQSSIEARRAAEEKANELERQVTALTAARDSAERSLAAQSTELTAERAARQAADQAAALANERLTHRSAAAPRPTAAQLAKVESSTLDRRSETRDHREAVPALATRHAANPAAAELATGNALLSAGNIAAAREHFETAARLGLAEAALALGNTFDAVSLTKIGAKTPSDPAQARKWYRRAYAMALRQK